jgi:class 3 adenylate cyclase/pimeloyl-ACP methyl ester carboxylesterase
VGAVRPSEIRYAKADEHHIAFRELVGEDGVGHDIVMVNGGFFPMESLPDDPVASRLLEGLSELGRLIVFDRRGVALSDPVSDWDTPLREQWAEDLAAVIKAAGCDRPTVFSWHSVATAQTCAVRYPELIGQLILFNPPSPPTDDDTKWLTRWVESLKRRVAVDDTVDGPGWASERGHDPVFRAWMDSAGRAGASPSQAARLNSKWFRDPPLDNTQITTPTLVITRVTSNSMAPAEFFERAARQIPDAQHVSLSPGDMWPFGVGVDHLLAEVSRYATGEVRLPAPERQIAVILFTDLVGSTRRAESAGDAAWKRLLDHHDQISHTAVDRRGGEVIKSTGDGVLALLPSATAAIDAAHAIRTELRGDDLEVRIGIHVGELHRRGGDVSGLAVHIAARIMASAEPGQILTSEVVARIANAATFTGLGPRTLKDVDGTWEVFTTD